jgi:hypothetical protein
MSRHLTLAIGFAAGALFACSKSSPALQAFTPFADAVAKGHSALALTLGEPELRVELGENGGDPEPGLVLMPIGDQSVAGYVSWTRYKLESETKTDEGATLSVLADVCRAERLNDPCARPAQLRYRVAMREADGTWKVSGMTTEILFDPRR